MRISDWSSDVCSSDLNLLLLPVLPGARERLAAFDAGADVRRRTAGTGAIPWLLPVGWTSAAQARREIVGRSEEHTSELQSLMRISYAVFCLKKKKIYKQSYK